MQFVRVQTAWFLTALVLLALLDALTLELFFVLAFLGFLVIIELTAPFAVAPEWRRRLRLLILVGLVGFGYVVVTQVLAGIPEGLF